MKRFVYCFGTILLYAFNFLLSADTLSFSSETTVRVYGKVTDESGEPVPEAMVMFISQTDTTSTLTDTSGMYSVELSPVSTHVSENQYPDIFLLHQNYPNPFNPGTVIQYELKRSAHVKLNIYNVAGHVVRCLRDNLEGAGIHSVQWDGRDNDGKGVSAGVYLYRLQAGGFSQTKKMVLVDGGQSGPIADTFGGSSVMAKAIMENKAVYEIVVEKEGFKTCYETEFRIQWGTTEIKKDFILQKTNESYLLNFDTNHFYNWYYEISDTVYIRLLSTSDLSINPTDTEPLPSFATLTITTELGDSEVIKLQKGGSFYISYFEKCGEWPDVYLQSLQGLITSTFDTLSVKNNGILEVNADDVISAFYTSPRGNTYRTEIPISNIILYNYNSTLYEFWHGMWYSSDSYVYNDRFAVKFIESASDKQIITLNNENEVYFIKMTYSGLYILSVPEGLTPFEIVEKYNEYEIVEWAEVEGGGCFIIP